MIEDIVSTLKFYCYKILLIIIFNVIIFSKGQHLLNKSTAEESGVPISFLDLMQM